MSAQDWPTSFLLHPSKVADYLLNLQHDRGASKARFFRAFGFSALSPDILATELLRHPTPRTFVRRVESEAGFVKLVFEGTIDAPDGRAPFIRTVWRLHSEAEAHFVTAVPLTGRGKV